MKGFWLILVAGSLSATPVAGSFFEQFWANDQDFFDKINDKIEESNKTEPPTSQPTMEPTLTPTVAPTKSPSYRPSSSPTESAAPSVQPSFSPSVQPSIHPTLSSQPSTQPSLFPSISAQPSSQPSTSPTTSAKPSTSPTLSTSPSTQPSTEPTNSIAPSNEPSLSPTTTSFPSSQPSAHPSISTHPTLTTAPSSQPSLRPSTSTMPSSSPSSNPSYTPTTAPSSSPSEEPSVVPSEAPSETKPITTRIIIKSDSTNKNMIAVGAVCLLLMASAVAYVTKNAKRLKGRERNDFHKFPSLQFSSSMSQSSDEPDQQQHDAAKLPVDFVAQSYSTNNRQDDHDDTDMVDIDLEDGRACMRTEDSVAESSIGLNSLPSDVKEKRVSTISKIFKRRPIGAEKQGMSWMDIRDEGSPACSSGCEPAKGENSLSSLSPKFSPFKNISSMRTKMQSLVSISSEDTDDLPSVEGSFNGDHNLECVGLPTIFSENEGVPESFNGNTTTVERQECLDLSSISNGIQERTIHTDTECVGSPSSIFSGLGGESSSEAREVSRQSFEQSMNQLKNILGTIKSLGSYEESLISASSAGASVEDFKNRAKARLGLNQGQVNDHQIASSHSQESLPSHREVNMPRPDITYEKELLSAAGSHCDGFDFNTVFSDPRNEVYQCNVPSGPLGIVVEATKVGLRVQKINSMSPLRNKISVGDIIIAVDEVDVVGVDPGVFWQLVSRRANKQQRCFVVLRI